MREESKRENGASQRGRGEGDKTLPESAFSPEREQGIGVGVGEGEEEMVFFLLSRVLPGGGGGGGAHKVYTHGEGKEGAGGTMPTGRGQRELAEQEGEGLFFLFRLTFAPYLFERNCFQVASRQYFLSPFSLSPLPLFLPFLP